MGFFLIIIIPNLICINGIELTSLGWVIWGRGAPLAFCLVDKKMYFYYSVKGKAQNVGKNVV